MPHLRHLLVAGFATAWLVAVGSSAPANAGVIAYDFDITCERDCDVVDLAPGGKGSGFIALDEAAFLVDSFVDEDALVDFAVEFGNVAIDPSTASVARLNAKLENVDTLELSLIAIALFEAIAPDSGDFIFANLANSFTASTNAFCIDAGCSDAELGDQARGRLGPLLPRIVDVPEPGGLALFGAALLGLVVLRRRRPAPGPAMGQGRLFLFAAPLAATLALLTAGDAAPARAGVITYDFDITCERDCDIVGLETGDKGSGFIAVDDESVLVRGAVTQDDLVDFAFEYGDISIDATTAGGVLLFAILNSSITLELRLAALVLSEALAPDRGDHIFASVTGSFFATPSGACIDAECTGRLFDGEAVGSFSDLLPRAVDVPEPGSLVLLGAGLLGLFVAHRRRRPDMPPAGGQQRGASLAAPLAAALALPAVGGLAMPAQAGAITYDLDAVCQVDCANVGLSSGDAISGFITFDDAGFAPDAFISAADVIAFDFAFGDVAIDNVTASGLRFFGRLAADGLSMTIVDMIVSEALIPDLGDTLFADATRFFGTRLGNCSETCIPANISAFLGRASVPTLTPRLAAVPEPRALGLVLVSLGGLLIFGRRYAVRAEEAGSNNGS